MYQIEVDTCTNDCFTKLIDCVRTCPMLLDSFLPVICDTSCKSECVSYTQCPDHATRTCK